MCQFARYGLYIKFLCAIAIILLASACSLQKVKTVELSPDELRQKIVSGEIFKKGESVNIVTADGQRHSLQVLDITEEHIIGSKIASTDDTGVDKDTPTTIGDFDNDQPSHIDAADIPEPNVETVDIPIADVVTVELIKPTVMAYTLATSTMGAAVFVLYILPGLIIIAMLGV